MDLSRSDLHDAGGCSQHCVRDVEVPVPLKHKKRELFNVTTFIYVQRLYLPAFANAKNRDASQLLDLLVVTCV